MARPKPSDVVEVKEEILVPAIVIDETESPIAILDKYMIELDKFVEETKDSIESLEFKADDEVAIKLFAKDIAYYNNVVKGIDRMRIDTMTILKSPIDQYDKMIKAKQLELTSTIQQVNNDRKAYELERVTEQRNGVLATIQKLLNDMELPEINGELLYKDSYRNGTKKAFDTDMETNIKTIQYHKSTMVAEVYRLYVSHLDPLKALQDYELATRIVNAKEEVVETPKIVNEVTASYITIKVTPQDLETIKKLNIDFVEVI